MRANACLTGDAHVRSRVRPGLRVVAQPGQTGQVPHRQNRCPLIGESARRDPKNRPRSRLLIGIFCEKKPPEEPYNTVGFGGKKRPGRQRTLGEGGQAMDTNRERGQTEPPTPGRSKSVVFLMILIRKSMKIDDTRGNSSKIAENRRKSLKIDWKSMKIE